MDFNLVCEGIEKSLIENNSKSNNNINNNINYNLSKLLKTNLLHSQSVKFGKIIEELFVELSNRSETFNVVEIKQINSVQIDLLIKNNKTNEMYYFEIKSNANLDSEKWNYTFNKLNTIQQEICKKYNNKYHTYILTPWYEIEKRCHPDINQIK